MTNNNYLLLSHRRNCQLTAKCWSCFNVVQLRASFGFPSVLLWFSYGALTWIRSAFLDEPSGRAEREEDSKVMRIYPLFMDISELVHEAGLVAPCAYVLEVMNPYWKK